MIIRIFCILILLLSKTYANQNEGSIKNIKFVPDHLLGTNNVELIGKSQNLDKVYYKMGECRPIVQQDENGKKLYRPSKIKAIKYVENLSLPNRKEIINLKINGKSIKGSNLKFSLINNCTQWLPIHFIAAEDQEYLGLKIKKESLVTPFYNNSNRLNWGEIAEDGYLKAGRDIDPKQDESLIKKFESFEYAKKVYSSPPSCIEVVESIKDNTGFYIFAEKKVPFEYARPNFWRARSKYIGHKLCSDQPEAVVDCEGSIFPIDEREDDIFGTSGPDLSYAVSPEEKEKAKNEYQKALTEAQELGKKCDDVIAQHEKKTGKKVKISPYYPKELLKKEKFK